MSQTLYEITGDILALQNMLEDGEDEQTVADTMEAVMMDFADKADAYGKVIRNLESRAEAIGSEIERLQERKKTLANGIDRMKNAIRHAMEVTGTDKIEGDLFNFSMRNNAPQLPKDLPDALVPEKFWKPQDPTVDRKGLLAAVKSGEVKGIDLVTSRSMIMR